MPVVECGACSKPLERSPRWIAQSKTGKFYCSSKCSAKGNTNRLGTGKISNNIPICPVCGKSTASQYRKYCSWKGHGENRKAPSRIAFIHGEQKSQATARRFLLEIRGHRCEVCGLEEWRGQPIPLVLDHIDGHSEDTSIDNLRLVCANCDAQLPTYKSKNKGNGRFSRRQRYADGKSS